MQREQVILLKASGATGLTRQKQNLPDRGKSKKADGTGNLCDSNCADCKTAHGLDVESNCLVEHRQCAGSCKRPGSDGHTIS